MHAFCKESEVISVNVNRCIGNAYRYLRCIQVTTKPEFTANDKNTRVLVTYNDCIKDDEMLWCLFLVANYNYRQSNGYFYSSTYMKRCITEIPSRHM